MNVVRAMLAGVLSCCILTACSTMAKNGEDFSSVASPADYALKISNDRFELVIPTGVAYDPDIEQKILQYMDWIEKAGGLSFDDKVYFNSGYPDGIQLGELEYTFHHYLGDDTCFFELTRLLQKRTVEIECAPFTVGYATFIGVRAMELGELNNSILPSSIYAQVHPRNSENLPVDMQIDLEEYFLNESNNDYDNKVVGFLFSRYIEDAYGEGINTKIITDFAANAENAENYSSAAFVESLKKSTSYDVFLGFHEWYNENIYKKG